MRPESVKILRTWLPLLATWLMMGVEGPIIAAFIARLPDPTVNLAAYGVALSLALILEAPIIMLLSAATTLVQDDGSYRRLRLYMLALTLLVALAGLLLLWPDCFDLLARRGLELPLEVRSRVARAMVLLLPWPAAIGVRRFYQGVVLASGRTRQVTFGTCLRLTAMALSCGCLARFSDLDGAAVGGAALSTGVVTEAIAALWLARTAVAEVRQRPPAAEELHFGRFWRFYYPLMLTSILALAVQPIVTFSVGRAKWPLESLAVLPVVNGIVFFFRCFSLSFQDAALATLRAGLASAGELKSFAKRAGLGLSAVVLFIVYTPLAALWLQQVAGIDRQLKDLAVLALRIACLTPLVSMILALYTALAIYDHSTRKITAAGLIELGMIALALSLGIYSGFGSGAVIAVTALLLGRVTSTVWLSREGLLRRFPGRVAAEKI